ncbi:hypothetical protein RJ55_08635 [Drechmeria coniospora]|nr:hypothetical protein RJ55_08635 [Drechmeria coniospora]
MLSPRSAVKQSEYEDMVNGFLGDIAFRPPDLSCDPELERRVKQRLRVHGVPPALIERIQGCIDAAVSVTTFTYPFTSPSCQEAIALYSAYTIGIDDLAPEMLKEVGGYTMQLTLGQPHQHPLLRGLTSFLGEQSAIFGPFGGDMIVKGTLESVSSVKLETTSDQTMDLPRAASTFLHYFRMKTGFAEAYAFFCFPEDAHPEETELVRYISSVPNIMTFLCSANDLLSFYKEETNAKEADGYVKHHAKLHRQSTIRSLRQVTKDTVQVVQNLRASFAPDEPLGRHMEQLIQGYIMYHLSSPRYKLASLRIPAAMEVAAREQRVR